jgi:hypothetical protein
MIINAFGRQIKPRTQIQIVLAILLIIFLLVAVPTLSIVNNNYSNLKRSQYKFGKVDPLKAPQDFSGAVIWANITGVDTLKFTIDVRYTIIPAGRFAKDIGTTLKVFKDPVEFITKRKKTLMDENVLYPEAEAVYPIEFGNPVKYPYDVYMSSFVLNMQSSKDGTIPVMLGIVGAVQGWDFDINVNDLVDGYVNLQVRAKRSQIIKFFSGFVVTIMWILSVTALTLSATIWFRDRKIESSTISFCGSLMFALPAVRNTQPGAPSII